MTRISSRYVVDQVISKLSSEYDHMSKLNIMVLGKTGVGKSTLINSIFETRVVEAGVGKPVTNNISKVEQQGFPLVLFDTPGLELTGANDFDSLTKQITSLIKQYFTDNIEGNEIHCILYCVSTASHRFEAAEADFLKSILEGVKDYNVPVIVVLTQSFSRQDAAELKGVIENENLPIAAIVPVLADEYEVDEDLIIPPYGLDELTETMSGILPDAIRKTFIALEKANYDLKVKRSRAVITSASLTAAAIGATPIPMADAAILIPDMITMLVGITMAFGLPVNQKSTQDIINNTIGALGRSVFGRTVKNSLFKMIPAAGLFISAASAATLTESLGETYIRILTMIGKGEIKMEDVTKPEYKDMVRAMFKERVQTKKHSEKIEKTTGENKEEDPNG
ncbi:small GTP-binding protein domain-containing protein [Ruminococcaceae bacterium YRB3002]|nr:small GTP-binding protein domain-containing protein [Ruminococcaceae bacterium YRB3002]